MWRETSSNCPSQASKVNGVGLLCCATLSTLQYRFPLKETNTLHGFYCILILHELSCNGADDAPATSSFHTAAAGSHATGDLSAVTGDQLSGHRCPDGCSPAHHPRHFCLSVQHFCGSSPDGRTLHQPCHRKTPSVCPFGPFNVMSCPLSTPLLFAAQFNAASLGAQPQFLSSLTSTPIITSAMSNMAGITSQIITNAQGQASPVN